MSDLSIEYDKYYIKNPKIWENEEHDYYIACILEQYLSEQPKTLLDIGCGNGHTIEILSKEFPDTQFWGLDPSVAAINLARTRCANGIFICDTIECMKPQKFDAIVSVGVFEHILDYIPALKKLRQFLNGIMYMEVPNCISYKTSKHEEGFRQLNQGNRQMEWHLYRETWEKRLIDAGFEIVSSIKGPSVYTEFEWILV